MRKLEPGLRFFSITAGLLVLGISVGACATGDALTAEARRQSERISGSYEASFTTRSGLSRQGKLVISPLGKLLYWLEFRDASSFFSGRGALAGEALLAVWGSGQSRCLAAMLDVGADGSLEGIWFRAEDRNGATSTIQAHRTQGNGNDLSGAYTVLAEGPDTSNLPRDLQVEALGNEYYRFLWKGDEDLEGYGRLDDRMILVVASFVGSGDECRISEMKLAGDGSLTWKWLISGAN